MAIFKKKEKPVQEVKVPQAPEPPKVVEITTEELITRAMQKIAQIEDMQERTEWVVSVLDSFVKQLSYNNIEVLGRLTYLGMKVSQRIDEQETLGEVEQ